MSLKVKEKLPRCNVILDSDVFFFSFQLPVSCGTLNATRNAIVPVD